MGWLSLSSVVRRVAPPLALTVLAAVCNGLGSPGRAGAAGAAVAPIDFNRDIHPILSENCFKCHGPDAGQRKAKLRLDTRDGALAKGTVLVPGHANQSELFDRVSSADPQTRMPPVKSGKRLTPRQVELLRQWIDQGANYA